MCLVTCLDGGWYQVLDHMLVGTVMCLQVMCTNQVISQVMDHVMVGQMVKGL